MSRAIRIPPPSDPIARLIELNAREALERGESVPAPATLQTMPLSTNVSVPTGPAVFGSERVNTSNDSIRRLSVTEYVNNMRNPELTDDIIAAFNTYREQQLDESSRDASNSLVTSESEAQNERISRAVGQTRNWKSFLSSTGAESNGHGPVSISRNGEEPILGDREGMDIEGGPEEDFETLSISRPPNRPAAATTTTTTTTTTTSMMGTNAPRSSLVLRNPQGAARRSSSRIRSRSKTPEVISAPISTNFRASRRSVSRSNSRSRTSSRRGVPKRNMADTAVAAPPADRDAVIRAIASTLPTARQRQVFNDDTSDDLEGNIYNRAANQTRNVLQQRSVCFACNTHKYLIGKEVFYKLWRDWEDQIAFEFLTAPDSVINQIVDFYDNFRKLAAINHIDIPYMDHAKWYDHFLIHNLTPETIRHHMIFKMLGLADVLSKNAVLAAKRGRDVKDKLDVERTKALNAISNQLRHWLQLDVTNINIRTRLFLERASNPANNITTGGDNGMSASPLSLPLTFRVHHSLAELGKKKATIRKAKY